MSDENSNAGVEAMRAKYDELEAAVPEPAPEPVEVAPEQEPAEVEDKQERPRRPDGTFMSKEEAEKVAAPVKKGPEDKAKPSVAPVPPTPGKAAPVAQPVAATPAPEQPKLKAPASLKPQEREAWESLPRVAQEAFIRREQEVTRGLQEAAEHKKNWERFNDSVRPYEALIRSTGQDPVAYTQQLYQTAYALQTGTPQQRAAIMAHLFKSYGVDVDQFANALNQTATAVPQQGQASSSVDVQALVDQRIQQMARQAAVQRAAEEVAKFAETHEFANDESIRQTMAALIQGKIAANLEDAYDRAIRASPDHWAVIQQREAAAAAKANVASTQQKRAAAVSVRSTPAVPATSPKPKPGEEGLEAMRRRWEELGMG